jgi:hypothetical protein
MAAAAPAPLVAPPPPPAVPAPLPPAPPAVPAVPAAAPVGPVGPPGPVGPVGPPGPVLAAPPVAPDNLPGPGGFQGTPLERGRDWIQTFNLWAAYRNHQDPAKLNALPFFLKDAALRWYNTLPGPTKANWGLLQAAFNQRYGLNAQAEWQRASLVWKCHQTPGEAVLDFISRILQAADDAGIPADNPAAGLNQRRHAVISGLKPTLRQHVLHQNPVDLPAVQQAAALAEQCELPVHQDTLTDSIARLEQQMQQLTLATVEAVQPRSNPQSTDHPPPRGASPTNRYYNQSPQQPATTFQRPSSPSGFRPPYPATSSPRPTWTPDRRVTFKSTPYARPPARPQRDSQQPVRPCLSCGGAHRRDTCRVRWVTCRKCNKEGHIAAVCRSTQPTY